MRRVTLIPGDGVGPEIVEACRRVIEASGVKIDWDVQEAGAGVMEKYGTPLPIHVLDSIRASKVALKGPVTTPVASGFRSINVALRRELDLYVNLRPAKSIEGVLSPYKDIDLVVVRENTEDLYIGIEFERGTPAQERLLALVAETAGQKLGEDTGVSLKVITERGTRRIIQFAFDYARKHGRRKVTAVHKANILKYSDGLFLSVAREVAREYRDIEFEDIIVDTLCMQLVRRPERFDVLVLPNLYGDFVSELCAGLIGGLGLAPGANIGAEFAVFEPTHGSAPKHAGMNRINPMAMMLSGVLMLRHLGEKKAADRLEGAIARVIQEGKKVTYDLKRGQGGNPATTSEVAEAVLEALTREV